MGFAEIAALVVAIAGIAASAYSADKQHKANRELAEYQASENEKYLQSQLQYNTPESQMLRYQQAGLNPNLIYGQGTPGNQASPLTFPDVKAADYQRINVEQVLPLYNQTRMAEAQVNAQNAKTLKSFADTEVAKLQASVLKKNPLLDTEGFRAIIDGLKATAALKEQENYGAQIKNFVSEARAGYDVSKAAKEVDLLEQRFRLSQLDEKIKGEVLNSKEFQNAILEVQKKFMADGEVGAQQVMQFIMLLLGKSL